MNERFYDLTREKQDRFINAACKLFAENGYKKASTDDIVKAAGISKGLLFHYFGSKQGLYVYVYEYSTRYVRMEYDRSIPREGMDFFELQKRLELVKRDIIRHYPYMPLFIRRAFRENDEELISLLADNMDQYSALLTEVYGRAHVSRIKPGIDPSDILKLCLYASDGILNDQFLTGNVDPEAFLEESLKYLSLLEKNLCRHSQ
ncbi:MAG: TetR/AcrR family transcriptional regulator [Lachnospiraceae bacterium]|nr:TetR/AcrR family transcriptional regulator [Lachnospiraceae bacterium]